MFHVEFVAGLPQLKLGVFEFAVHNSQYEFSLFEFELDLFELEPKTV